MIQKNQLDKKVLTLKETAEYLQVGLSTLDKLDIPCYKFRRTVRYDKSIIDEWLKKNSQPKATGGKNEK